MGRGDVYGGMSSEDGVMSVIPLLAASEAKRRSIRRGPAVRVSAPRPDPVPAVFYRPSSSRRNFFLSGTAWYAATFSSGAERVMNVPASK